MTAVLVAAGVLLFIGSVIVIGYAFAKDRPEDLGRVTERYMRSRGWWRHQTDARRRPLA